MKPLLVTNHLIFVNCILEVFRNLLNSSMNCKYLPLIITVFNSLKTSSQSNLIIKGTSNSYQLVSNCSSNHSMRIIDGILWSWGMNENGQLGDGTTINRMKPVRIDSTAKWLKIATSDMHSLGIKSDSTLWAWGFNRWGEIGDGTITQRNFPVRIGLDNKWIDIGAYSSSSYGLKTDGTIWIWGFQIRNDGTGNIPRTPRQIVTDGNWTSLSIGGKNNYALKSNGSLWAWGENRLGLLGNNTSSYWSSPVQIGVDTNWKKISAGYAHCLGIKSDGTLWSWGWNGAYQLGDGTYNDKVYPSQIGTDKNWTNIAAGSCQSLGLKSDGTLWVWGTGGLGIGTSECKTPVQIGWDNKWVSIASGSNHILALKSDGTLWSWGLNTFGQVGDGTIIKRTKPIQINKTEAMTVNDSFEVYFQFMNKGEKFRISYNHILITEFKCKQNECDINFRLPVDTLLTGDTLNFNISKRVMFIRCSLKIKVTYNQQKKYLIFIRNHRKFSRYLFVTKWRESPILSD